MGSEEDWREVVRARAERVRHDLIRSPRANQEQSTVVQIGTLLEGVKDAADTASSLRTRWDGRLQDKAWLNIHEAEAEAVHLLDDADLRSRCEEVLMEAHAVLGAGEPRLQHLDDLVRQDQGLSKRDEWVAEAEALTRAVYDLKDEAYAQSRTFRNRLVRLTAMAVVATVLLVVATASIPIDLSAGSQAIGSGWETPLLITLFGAVGAFVTAIPAMSRMPGTRNPYSLPLYQFLLKLGTGPVFAFLGIVALQGKVVADLTPATSMLDLLVWAAVFGGVQQTVTRLVDRRASTILTADTPAGGGGQSRSRKTPSGPGPIPASSGPVPGSALSGTWKTD